MRITFDPKDQADNSPRTIDLPWTRTKASHTDVQPVDTDHEPSQKLLEAVARAQVWLADLAVGRFSSIEELATAAKMHPKVVRQALRLAFLSPSITAAILTGDQSANPKLAGTPKVLVSASTNIKSALDLKRSFVLDHALARTTGDGRVKA